MSYAYLAGTNPYNFSCPDGEILTSVNFRAGSGLDQISTIFCRPPNRLSDTSYSGTQKDVNVGGNGGGPFQFKCPLGSGISGVTVSYDNDIIRTFKPICSELKSGYQTLSYAYGNNGAELANKKSSNCGGSGKFITGMTGQNGKAISKMDWNCGDFTQAQKGLFTDEGKVNCCTGQYGTNNCPLGLTPQSGQCDQFMVNWCQTHSSDPRCSCIMSEMTCPNKFDTNCIKQNGYRTNDMAKTPCPSIMNCTQFLSLSPGAQSLATGVQQDCKSTISSSTDVSANIGTPNIGVTPVSDALSSYSMEYIILIFLFLLIVILASVYFYVRKK